MAPMAPYNFPIERDEKYWKTLRSDLRRYGWRRRVHRVQGWLETQLKVPGWRAYTGKSPSLSTCLITMNSVDRILPLLEYIRPWSDEVVVAVDSKCTDNTFEVCRESGLVDELFVFENPYLTCNGGLEAMVERCHGDWVLRLDDDEFPEPHWADIKSGVLANSKETTHFKLPRLHLSHVDPVNLGLDWIDDSYLYPDYQMRLFQNKKELLSYPGAVGHGSIECQGPRGKIHSVNLVHLNMAMNPRWKREEKLRKYVERLEGGWVHPVNEHALLFEDFNYTIKPYTYPNVAFRQRLIDTAHYQREQFQQQKTGQPVETTT